MLFEDILKYTRVSEKGLVMSAEKILSKIVQAVQALPKDNRATLIQFASEDERENFSLTGDLVIRVRDAADVLALLVEIQDTDLVQ